MQFLRRYKEAVVIGSIILSFAFFAYARASFNEQVNYQGKLTNTADGAVSDGLYLMKFELFATSTGGAAVWTENRSGTDKVQVTNGLFSVMLGEISSLSSVDFNQDLWLEVSIGTSSLETMTPRKHIGAVPAAFEAKKLQGQTWDAPGAIGGTTPSSAVFSRLTVRPNSSSIFSIVSSSGEYLLDTSYVSQRFGTALNAGAFISRNSYIDQEFNAYRTTRANAADYAGNQAASFGDNRGWGVYSSANNCTYGQVTNGVNGRMRLQANVVNRGCMTMMDETANVPRQIISVDNTPVILMKVAPSNIGANNVFYAGLASSTDGQTTTPTPFIGFTNAGGSTWTGVTVDSAGNTTAVSCSGQTVKTNAFAELMIEVRTSTEVRFFVDNDVTDGVNFTECGRSQSNIPAGLLSPYFTYQARAGGTANTFLDIDFFRAWQDDEVNAGYLIFDDVLPIDEVLRIDTSTHNVVIINGAGPYSLTVSGTSTLATTTITQLSVSGALSITSATPASTAGALYNSGGILYWDGSSISDKLTPVGMAAGQTMYWSGSAWTATSSLVVSPLNGYIGIGTSTPAAKLDVEGSIILTGPDNYVNFGSAAGSAGYGFRDSGGRMQFKNSAGDWQNIVTKIDHIINVAKMGGDYDNLMDAVAAANASAEDTVIEIYPGYYTVSSTLTVTSSRFKGITGKSEEGVVLVPSAGMVADAAPVIEVALTTTTDFGLRQFSIDGSQTPGYQTTPGCSAIKVSSEGGRWMNFYNITVRGTYRGIEMAVANMVNSTNMDFYEIGQDGVYLDNGASLQVMGSYFEDVGGYYAHIQSMSGASSFYMVGSEFGSNSNLGTGLFIAGDDSYAEIRQSNMWGLDANIVANDNSEVQVIGSFLEKPANLNIEQKDTAKVTVIGGAGAFSSTDVLVNDSSRVYFNTYSQTNSTTIIGNHSESDQILFKIDEGTIDSPYLAYRGDYYGGDGMLMIDPNLGEASFLASQSANADAKIIGVSGNRNADSILSLYSESGDFGSDAGSRGWDIVRAGANAGLQFNFKNNDAGDGLPLVPGYNLLHLDGFSSILSLNGGAVFNSSSGNFDFRVKGVSDSNLLFVQAGTDNVGIGTSSPAQKLAVAGNLLVAGNATATIVYAVTGTFDNLTGLNVAGTSTLNGPVLLGSYLKFTAAGDNYLYFADDDGKYMKWENAGNRFVLSNDLNIAGAVSSSAAVINGNATSTGNFYIGGNMGIGTGVDAGTQLSINASGGKDLLKIVGSANAGLYVHNSGKVIVGTTTILDGDMLEVVGTDLTSDPTSSKNFITMTAVGNGEAGFYARRIGSAFDTGWSWYMETSSLDFRLYDDSILDDVMTVQAGGNVGVGTINPGYKLTVAGTSSLEDAVPAADLAYNLGTAAQRWKNVYASTGTFDSLVINTSNPTNLNWTNATGTHLAVTDNAAFGQIAVSDTSTLSGPFLLGSYLKFNSTTDNYIYFANDNNTYLRWNNNAGNFYLTNGLDVNGRVTSTALAINGTANVNDLAVANSITLGGVSRSTWPSGGGGAAGFWVTTTANVAYPDLINPFAIVIGSSATTSNSIFEVAGNSKLAGNLLVTGNATTSRLYAPTLVWDSATGTLLSFNTSTGNSLTIAGLANLNGAVKVGDTSSTDSGIIKFSGNDFLGYDGGYWRSLTNVASVRGEATGFPNSASSAISFTDGSRTFSISPVSGSFEFYYQGAKYVKTTAQTTVIDDTEGVWYIFFDGSGTLQHSQNEPSNKNAVSVAQVYWNATDDKAILLGEYRGGLTMDADTHSWIRMTVGPRYSSGLTLSGSTSGDGTQDADAEVALTGGVIYDEDLKYTIVNAAVPASPFEQDLGTGSGSSVTAPAKIPVYYRLGASGFARKKSATSFPLYENAGGRISYNSYSSGWATSTVPDGEYVAVWLFSTHNINEPIIAVLGQRTDSDATDARMNNTYASLSLDSLPFQNMKVLYRLIFQTSDGYTNAVKAKIVDIQDHRDVSTLPSGNYVASAHGALTGLNQDDHLQYLLMAGRSGGQTVYGGSAAGSYLTLDSANNAAKGTVFLQPAGGNVVIGTSSAAAPNLALLSVQGNASALSLFSIASSSGAAILRINNNGFVGIGTNTPNYPLAVAGTSSLRDTVPETDQAYALGTPSLRWLNIYAVSGTFANLSVANPTHFATLTFDNAVGTGLTLSGSASMNSLAVSGTSTLSGPALLGSYLYFNNTTTNYLSWNPAAGGFAFSNGLSIDGTVTSTGLVVNNSTSTGVVYISGSLNVSGTSTLSTGTVSNLTVTGLASTSQFAVSNTSTINGPLLLGSYLQFATAGNNYIFFNNTTTDYLQWDNAAGQFALSNSLNINGFASSTGLTVNGTASTTDLYVGNSITLGGVTRTTWPTGGGGGSGGPWSTTTANVAYINLASPYAVVIGSSATTSNVIFEVAGNSKFGGNVNVTGNATSTNFYATNMYWGTASGANLLWTSATGTNLFATNSNFSNLLWTSATGTNLAVTGFVSTTQIYVSGTSTLSGQVRYGSSTMFTIAGDNYMYFGNSAANYLRWNNSASRFELSAGLSVNGAASSTALTVNGNATTTGNLYVGGRLNVSATSTLTTTSINSLLLADGTAALPSLAFISDIRTGLYHPAGDGLAFSTSGTERMRILSNGNVGINTTTPQYKFTIADGEIAVVSGTATGIFGIGAFPNNPVATTDPIGLTTNAGGMYRTGLITEVGGQLLSFAINAAQLGNRSTTAVGAIFRLDTRTNTPYWSLKRQAIGGSTEYSDFQISTDGDMGIGAGHASDLNTFAGQLHIFNRTSSVIGLVVQGQNGQSRNLQEWRDYGGSTLSVVDAAGNIGIGTSSPNARLFIMAGAGNNLNMMTVASTTGVELLQAKNLSENFGLAMNAGAFMDRNSTIQEEFNTYRTQRTADTTGANGAGMGDGGGWGVYEGGPTSNCVFTTMASTANGVLRNQSNTGNQNGCLVMMDEALNTPHNIINVGNLPVFLIKVKPSVADANHRIFVGAANTTDGQVTDPSNFIGFTNAGTSSGYWTGRTTNGGSSTNIVCQGQAVSTSQFALLMVETRNTGEVYFFVDNDVSDGVSFVECGSSTSDIPTATMPPELIYQVRANGAGAGYLDIDFFRAWMDDSAPNSNALVLNQPVLESQALDTDVENTETELSVDEKLQMATATLNLRIDALAESVAENMSGLNSVLQNNNASILDAVSSTAFLGGQVDILNASAQATREMLAGLDSRIAVLENAFASSSVSLAGLQSQLADINLQYNSSTAAMGLLQGGYLGNISTANLSVNGSAEFKGELTVKGLFSVGADSAGQARILPGATSTKVSFINAYQTLPIVNITPVGLPEYRYGVISITTSSFVIVIHPPQTAEATFNWLAVGSSPEAVISVSDGTTSSVNFVVTDNLPLPEIVVSPPVESIAATSSDATSTVTVQPDNNLGDAEAASTPVSDSPAEGGSGGADGEVTPTSGDITGVPADSGGVSEPPPSSESAVDPSASIPALDSGAEQPAGDSEQTVQTPAQPPSVLSDPAPAQ